ncbi:NAD(P)-binding domain-containing protein [Thalassospira sp. MA62]|nr:NAD(P)-binding domain-containing protein [Thalassospira sp. MA62]
MTFLINTPDPDRIEQFRQTFADAFPDLPVASCDDPYDPADIKFIFTWQALPDWDVLPNLEIVFSVSAGIDQFANLPAHIKLIRMVDPKNTQRVTEYVLAACLGCLRAFPEYGWLQRHHTWAPKQAGFAQDTKVGILGLGGIGQHAAKALSLNGFQVSGWSRTPKDLSFVTSYSGKDGFDKIIGQSDILVCLLPLTDQTKGILDRELFAQTKPGASLVHVGRGAHCNFTDLKNALETQCLSQAFIDVFVDEPLLENRPEWDMPNCVITPHVAGRIDPKTAVENVAQNLTRYYQGQDLLWQVDRALGY